MRWIRSVVVLFLAITPLWGEAKIPPQDQVKNQQPGYCMWASLETVCRHQGVKAGYNLVEKRKLDPDRISNGVFYPRNLGDDYGVEKKLHSLGIRYRMNHTGNKDRKGISLIVEAVEKGHGAIIGLWNTPMGVGHHAVVIVDINNDRFSYVDSNTPGAVWEGSTDWFLTWWDGMVVIIDQPK